MEGGREQNYWPGFVDALSNVVLTLVFVLVVFVFALVMASNKVERKADEMIQAAHEKAEAAAAAVSDPTKMIATLKEKLTQAEAEIQILKQKLPSEEDARLSDKPSLIVFGEVKIIPSSGKITIYYPGAVSDLDERSRSNLGGILDTLKDEMKGKKIAIRSYTGIESFSAARRLAYYRAMGMRNVLLGRPELASTPITSRIEQSKESGNGRVEVIYGEK